ncbi:MAG: YgcG family protein [Granulosicoccus sp.]
MKSIAACVRKRTATILRLAVLCSMAISVLAYAQTFPDLTGRVVDQAQLLDPTQEASISAQLEAHEAQTSNQIVVVTIADLKGYAIADYANRLGRAWQIGTAENDNGALLLVAPASRKVRIEVGYGLEGALTDSLSSIIIQREILPAFRDNDYALGINRGVSAILSAVEGEYSVTTDTTGQNDNNTPGAIDQFVPLIFIAMVALTEILRRTGRRKAANGAFPAGFAGLFATLISGNVLIGIGIAIAAFLFIYFKGSGKGGGGTSSGRRGGYIGTGGFGGGGFGGGGFSGGGGSFGGGGASGSW